MNGVKQQISSLAKNHFSEKSFNHEYVQNFRQLLKNSTLQLNQESIERFEKFIGERTEAVKKLACDVKYLDETYELLLTILKNLKTEEVCYYFHDLLDQYRKDLEATYQEKNLDLIGKFPAETYEGFVKVIWPYVKLDYVASTLVADEKNNELIKQLLDEVDEYLRKPSLLKEDCYKIVENHVKSKDFKLHSYDLKYLDERPGYLGDYFKVHIIYSQSGHQGTLNLFAKSLPSTLFVNIAISTFPKEDFFYGEFMTKLKELGFEGIDDFIPRCYFSRRGDVIVMEDVSLQGYSVLKPPDYQEDDLARFIMKALARMHAASLMLEQKMSTKLGTAYRIDSNYYQFVQETAFSVTKSTGSWIKVAAHQTHENIIGKFPEVPKKIPMRIFQRRAEFLLRRMFFQVQKSEKFRNALSHGDLWHCNYLLKRGEDGKLQSCLLIDFQLSRYAPPVLDLLFFIYLNLSKHSRESLTESLVNQYYDDLAATFEHYNLDVNEVYTREQLWDSFNYFRPTGICMALCYAQMLSLPDQVLDPIRADEEKMRYFMCVERTAVFEQALEYPEFKAMMKALVEDLYECCLEMEYP